MTASGDRLCWQLYIVYVALTADIQAVKHVAVLDGVLCFCSEGFEYIRYIVDLVNGLCFRKGLSQGASATSRAIGTAVCEQSALYCCNSPS